MGLLDRFFGPPSRDDFAGMLKRDIEKAGEKDPIHYDDEKFLLHAKGEGEHTMYLTNAYKEYCVAPKAHRSVLVRNLVQTWFTHRKEMPEDFESAQHDLLPAIRDRMLFEGAALKMKSEGATKFHWPYRELAKVLGIGLVYDLPSSMMQLQQHHLDDWKTTFEAAYEVACTNLRELTKHSLNTAAPGVWVSPWRDNYDPSRILLIDYIRHHKVAGDPVVMVPNRDTLLLTGAKNWAGLEKMVEMAETAYQHARTLSGVAFRLNTEDEWVPFLPESHHPQYKKYRLLQIKTFATDYEEQKAILNAIHEKTGKDIFVASYTAAEMKDTGEIRSYCVWSEGVIGFLPKTDYIYFFRPRSDQDGDVVATVPWADAKAVLDDRIKPVGLYPERYLVEGFPSEEEIASFGFH